MRLLLNILWESIIKSFDEQPPGVAKTLGEYINDAKKTGVVDFKGMKFWKLNLKLYHNMYIIIYLPFLVKNKIVHCNMLLF